MPSIPESNNTLLLLWPVTQLLCLDPMQVHWLPLPSPYLPHVQRLKRPLGVPALGGVYDVQN